MTDTLKVPGATLSYDVAGTGPLLLLIPGGAMDSGPFTGLAAELADRYTVVRYDPRGISASPFDGEPADTDVPAFAADALALIEHLTSESAFVLGSSGGALVGLDLVARHPERVRRLVAHEPPCTRLLPDAEALVSTSDPIMTLYREQGPAPAMIAFLRMAGVDLGEPPADPAPQERAFMARMVANFDFFFGHMWAAIGAFVPDVDALRSRPVVLAVGESSGGHPAERATRELARRIGVEPATTIGHHTGFAEEPATFAKQLDAMLRA